MSNIRQQPDWWLGGDGRWHPPTPSGPTAPADLRAGPTGGTCPSGHLVAAGSSFCGECGQPVVLPANAGAGGLTPSSPGYAPGYAPAWPPSYAPGPSAGTGPIIVVRPRKSGLALVPCLGALLLAVAPFLSWVKPPFEGNLSLISYGWSASHSATEAILGATLAVALVVFVLPLTPLRASWCGAVVAVLGAAGAAVAVPETISLYRQFGTTQVLDGPLAAGIGFLLVIAGGIAYSVTGRSRSPEHRGPVV